MSENGVNKAPLIADATPVGWMGLAVACIVAAASLLGWVSADAAVYAAAISLACLLAYGTAAVTLLKRGDAVGGCTFAYFGAFFAGGPALNYLISWLAASHGWTVDGRLQGWVMLIVGTVLVLTTPIFMKFGSAAAWLTIVAADIAVLSLAFVFMGYGGSTLVTVDGWAFAATAVGGVINCSAGILAAAGWAIPLGPSLLRTAPAAGAPDASGGYV